MKPCPFRLIQMELKVLPNGKIHQELIPLIQYQKTKQGRGIKTLYCVKGDCMFEQENEEECPINKALEWMIR